MDRLQLFLKEDNRKLFEISADIYIKRVYTKDGIVFECCNHEIIATFKTKSEVLEWFLQIR